MKSSRSAFRRLISYDANSFARDLFAGITLAAIAIPEQMATARLGGFPAEIGFYAFLAGSLAFAFFGNNRFLSCGADSTITPIFAGGLALLAAFGSDDYTVLAAALALMVGLVLVTGGIFRFGWIADLLSVPVTIGFLVGISAHIIISQLPVVLGLPSPNGPMLHRVAILAEQLKQINPYTLVMGFGVLGVIAVSERTSPQIPGALVGVVAATAAVMLTGLENKGVSVVGNVSEMLPALSIPKISADQLARLIPLSLIIAAVVMVQTAATTRSFTSDPNAPPNIDRDFVGVGIGSILSGLFGAFPVNASPPRTAIVSESGGRSQFAGLVAAGIVLSLLVLGATLLRHVPHAALAGVLLFVGLKIVRVRQIIMVFRQSFDEFLLIVATAAAIVALPIEQGVTLGIVLSLMHGIWGTTRAHIVIFERVPGTSIWWPSSPNLQGEREPDIIVAGLQAPLSFLNAYHFRREILSTLRASTQKTQLIVLEATGIVDIDFTGAQILSDLIRECRTNGVAFAIARLESVRAQNAVERFRISELLGPGGIFRSVEEAVRSCSNNAQTIDATLPEQPK